LREDPTIL